LPQKYMLRLSA